jgi:hypothetical protein
MHAMKKIAPPKLLLAALLAVPFAALSAPPDACELLTPDEINVVAQNKVEKVQSQQSGNPSKCAFMDARRGAVVVLTLREVQYAVRDEMHHERENLEKIYRGKAKALDTIGEGGYWLGANKQLTFRKGKTIATLIFSTPKNQNEVDSAQLARIVESRLPK